MSKIKEFDRQVSETLKNADRFKGRYTGYLNISPKAKSVITDMDDNHNMSFAMLVYERNKGNLDKTALVYRGNEITYEELFEKVFDYAKSLKAMGYNSKCEIPACVSNSPEFIYLFLAANLIGAKLNVFGEWFDDEYTKFILNNSKSDYVFVSDDMYEHIASKIHGTNIKGIVTFSLSDSLIKNIDGKSINPYEGIDEKMHPGLFNNKVAKIKSEEKLDVFSQREFLRIGEKYNKSVVHDGSLNDPFAITYTSGTTNPGAERLFALEEQALRVILHVNGFLLLLTQSSLARCQPPSEMGPLAQPERFWQNGKVSRSAKGSLLEGAVAAGD